MMTMLGTGQPPESNGKRSWRRRRLLQTGTAAGVSMLAGAALPALASGGSAPVTYYACVTTKTGAVKIVPKATRCGTGQHKISWNSVGPQGPPGVVTGYQSFTEPDASLNGSSFTPQATLTLPDGAFLVNATVTFAASGYVDFACELTDSASTMLDEELTSSAAMPQAFLGLTGVTGTGGTETVSCLDDAPGSLVEVVSMTAIPVSSAQAKRAQLDGRHALPLPLPPVGRHGTPGSVPHFP